MNYQPFQRAVPVWAEGREKEMNVTLRFTAQVPAGKTLVRMTGSTVYRVFADGKLIAYGPARAAKYMFRVDEAYFSFDTDTVLVFEVAGYNINNYYTMDQPSFFCCEILQNNSVIAYTAPAGGMPCDVVNERIQKVQKFSFQRAFVEAWRMDGEYTASLTRMTEGRCPLVQTEDKVYLPRRVPFPSLTYLPAEQLVCAGTFTKAPEKPVYHDRSADGISPDQKGYPKSELDVCLSDIASGMTFVQDNPEKPLPLSGSLKIADGAYNTVKFAGDRTGFIGLTVKCAAPVTLMLHFEEVLLNGDINVFRAGPVNVLHFTLKPGKYRILSMEPYTLQYLKILADGTDIEVSDIHITEYAAPEEGLLRLRFKNEKFNAIWDAAMQTYRQNAVDLFTDCPCRERAGWLCDSFWTARVEKVLSGKCIVERNFLENFLLPDSFECLPKGMFPMCYPSDHYNKNYIPNWAMWLMLELEEYVGRSGDTETAEAFRPKMYDLVRFLDGYLNSDGLLEKLDAWVFVEWSKAAEWVQDVNFPSNMLYAATLSAMGRLYHDEALTARAEQMHETIRRLSFNGKFFTDHLVRNAQGVLENPGDTSEVCQYYAFYCGTASPETKPELWKTMLTDFGPWRKETKLYPEVCFANAFIGNYLRLDMMAKYGYLSDVLDNIEGYFYNMALTTGTLWENDSITGSLDHGFASHVIVWLSQARNEGLL